MAVAQLHQLNLTRKQAKFVLSERPEVLYAGAFGAAKSVALCVKLAIRANRPGARELLARVHLKYLKTSTLVTLLFGTSTTPPILTPGSYDWHKTDGLITFKDTGGQIVYGPLDDLAKLGSQEFSGAAFDECTDTNDPLVWEWLIGRCRREVEGMPGGLQVYGACNPSNPTHFLAQRFGIDPRFTAHEGTHLIRATTFDNPYLPRAYVEKLAKFQGMMYRRYVLGEWVSADGLVYGCWDRGTHMVSAKRGVRYKSATICVDDGYTDPFCALLIMERADGVYHVVCERYGPGYREEQKIKMIHELHHIGTALSGNVRPVVVDSAAADLIASIKHAGMPARGAIKDIENGISATRGMMEAGRLLVDPECVNLVGEVESYVYDPKTSKPVDDQNHGPDALRYGIMSIEAPGVIAVFKPDQARFPAPAFVVNLGIKAKSQTDALRAIWENERTAVTMVPAADGHLSVWEEPVNGRKYAVGIAGGENPCGTYATVLDLETMRVVAEMALKPGEDAGMPLAALILWFGAEVACVLASTAAGQVLADELASMGLPMQGGRLGYRPTEKEYNEAIMGVRMAWDGRQMYDPSNAVRDDAALYQWSGTRPEPAHVREQQALRQVWADRVMSRAAIMRVCNYAQLQQVEWVKDPITGESVPAQRRLVV